MLGAEGNLKRFFWQNFFFGKRIFYRNRKSSKRKEKEIRAVALFYECLPYLKCWIIVFLWGFDILIGSVFVKIIYIVWSNQMGTVCAVMSSLTALTNHLGIKTVFYTKSWVRTIMMMLILYNISRECILTYIE